MRFIQSTLALLPISLLSLYSSALALPVPDATLGTQNTPLGLGAVRIDGGTTVGQNLFHSFDSFNIDTGEFVYFFSTADVNHIFSRVTGATSSEIDGVLGTFGSDADLFLMNPNGVMFGPNASLDVQGSFITTTADAIELGPDGKFSALNLSPDRLLTVSPSAFFFSRQASVREITSQARTARQSLVNPTFISTGLQVPDGEALVLLGGEITIDGGQLNALSGKLELGTVSNIGKVEFIPEEYALMIPHNLSRADINVNNNSFLNVANVGGGDVNLYANNLGVLNSSLIISGIDSRVEPATKPSGDIQIDAAGTILVSDTSLIGNIVIGSGIGGNVVISAHDINVVNGSQISTIGVGSSSIGNITLQASDIISFSGRSSTDNLPSSILASTASFLGFVGQGNGGNIKLLAEQVNLYNGAFISSSVVSDINNGDRDATGNSGNITVIVDDFSAIDGSFVSSSVLGTGDGGDIVIEAQNRVVFDGVDIDEQSSTGAFTLVPPGTEGSGGNLEISTNILEITNGAQLSSSTTGRGNAGNIIIKAQDRIILDGTSENNQFFVRSTIDSVVGNGAEGNGGNVEISTNILEITNGALLTTSTSGKGNAGNIVASAQERIALVGNNRRNSGIFTSVTDMAQGTGGDVEIYTDALEINDNARISASTSGMGNAGGVTILANGPISLSNGKISVESISESRAGDIFIAADRLLLDDSSSLSVESNEVNGGDIGLTLNTLLLLRNNSVISATSGSTQAGGNGGNLTIKTPFIVAIPSENSDITANAFSGSGGQVIINADGVFGIEPRPELTPLSDITASSALGIVGGTVTLNSPDTSFIQDSLADLPDILVNPDTLVANSCVARSQDTDSTFVITGNSLANTPNSASPVYSTGTVQTPNVNTAQSTSQTTIIEPTGIYPTTDGRLIMGKEC